MLTIHKQTLEITDIQTLVFPANSKIISIGNQFGNDITLWYECYSETVPTTNRTFLIYGTGHKIDPKKHIFSKHLGTVVNQSGVLVWHVYEYNNGE